jgi:hypothetical protein
VGIIYKICYDQRNRLIDIQLRNYADTCSGVDKIKVFGFDKNSSLPKVIDSFSFFSQNLTVNYNQTIYKDSFYITLSAFCSGKDSIITSKVARLDFTPPSEIRFDSLSVANNKSVMGWQKSKENDVKGYIIYRTLGNINNPIDTVYLNELTVYTDSIIGNPASKRESYRIAPFDSCGNIANLSRVDTTLLLEYTTDTCKSTYTFTTKGYQSFEVSNYDLFVLEDTSLTINPFKTKFILNYKSDKLYKFYLRGYKKGDSKTTISSNTIFEKTNLASTLGKHYIKSTQYLEDNTYKLFSILDNFNNCDAIILQQLQGSRWKSVDSLLNPTSRFINFILTDTAKYKTFYRLVYTNKCSTAIGYSNAFPFYKISQVSDNELYNQLTYSIPDSSIQGFSNYLIKRYLYLPDSQFYNVIFNGFSIAESQFCDTNSYIDFGSQGVCYQLNIYHYSDSNKTSVDTSISNIVCTSDIMRVYIPNAIVRNGVNQEFRIKAYYYNPKNSFYQIYNRWGQAVTEQLSITTPWKGVSGQYIIISKIEDKFGNLQLFHSNLTVLD